MRLKVLPYFSFFTLRFQDTDDRAPTLWIRCPVIFLGQAQQNKVTKYTSGDDHPYGVFRFLFPIVSGHTFHKNFGANPTFIGRHRNLYILEIHYEATYYEIFSSSSQMKDEKWYTAHPWNELGENRLIS